MNSVLLLIVILDTSMFSYITPTLITEALRLVTQVQLLLTTVTMN